MKNLTIGAAALVMLGCASCAKQPYYSTEIMFKLEKMAQKAEKKLPDDGIAQGLREVITSESKQSAESAADKVRTLCEKLRTEKFEPHRKGLLIQNARALLHINQCGNQALIDAWQDETTEKRSPFLDTPEAENLISGTFVHHLTTCDLLDVQKKIQLVCSIKEYLDILSWDA